MDRHFRAMRAGRQLIITGTDLNPAKIMVELSTADGDEVVLQLMDAFDIAHYSTKMIDARAKESIHGYTLIGFIVNGKYITKIERSPFNA